MQENYSIFNGINMSQEEQPQPNITKSKPNWDGPPWKFTDFINHKGIGVVTNELGAENMPHTLEKCANIVQGVGHKIGMLRTEAGDSNWEVAA